MRQDKPRIDDRHRTPRPHAGNIDLFEGDIPLLRLVGLGAGKIENLAVEIIAPDMALRPGAPGEFQRHIAPAAPQVDDLRSVDRFNPVEQFIGA